MSQKGSLSEQEKQRHKAFFGSIKNKSLLRVAFLYYTFFHGSPTEPREAIKRRLWEKNLPTYNDNIALELKPSDVAPIIQSSEKAAQEYIDLLRILMV